MSMIEQIVKLREEGYTNEEARRLVARLTLNKMREYDLRFSQSSVRLMEMKVDACLRPGHANYSLQFWEDVRLYGLREAVLYIVNQKEKLVKNQELLDEVEKTAKMIIKSIVFTKPLAGGEEDFEPCS